MNVFQRGIDSLSTSKYSVASIVVVFVHLLIVFLKLSNAYFYVANQKRGKGGPMAMGMGKGYCMTYSSMVWQVKGFVL